MARVAVMPCVSPKRGLTSSRSHICAQIPSVPYPMSTPDDLARTVTAVEAEDRRIVALQADVRDLSALRQAFEEGVSQLGDVDIVLANAGIAPLSVEPVDEHWDDVLAVNLTGVYNTVRVALPSMIEHGRGGSIVITSSTAGLIGTPGNDQAWLAYTASKHGVVGLTKTWANYLTKHKIRVNSVAPGGVRTPMVLNEAVTTYLTTMGVGAGGNPLLVDMVEPVDISNAVLWLASDDARYVTGVILPVDGGVVNS